MKKYSNAKNFNSKSITKGKDIQLNDRKQNVNKKKNWIIASLVLFCIILIIYLFLDPKKTANSKQSNPTIENLADISQPKADSSSLYSMTEGNQQGNSKVDINPTAPTLNPAHGQPGHRCDIAVGKPLNASSASNPNLVNQSTPDNNKPMNVNKGTSSKKVETTQVKPNNSEITFTKAEYDYGTIKKDSDGSSKFIFKNTGTETLILSDAKASCGCTVPSWPKEPILPGKSGEINVMYDTKKVGAFSKTINVISNAKQSIVTLTIKGEVID
jgi:hypothetical protein